MIRWRAGRHRSTLDEEVTVAQDIRVTGLDHIVVNVADVGRSLRFYVDELGLEPVRVEEWRSGQVLFPSVRVDAGTILDLLAADRSGVNTDHFCLVVEATDFDALKTSGRFEVVDGPDRRFGARGDGISLYVRDPDGNTVELRYYE
jgi:catechol 2,3-dioxygenase-like lactoylglutathione lyase family enzyme